MSTDSTKTIKGRISNKHGTEEYWIKSVYKSLDDLSDANKHDNPFVPLPGELIIYDPVSIDETPKFKFGDPENREGGRRNVVDLPFASSNAIIDVTSLPTEDINENIFYRVVTGTFVFNQYVQNTYTVYCVDGLPEVGEPATNADMSTITAYYNAQDGEAYGYVDNMLSQFFGVPIGWYPASILFQAAGIKYKGIITDILDDPRDGSYRILLERVMYSYKDGKWTSNKTIGWTGDREAAEVFNLPWNKAYGAASHAEGRGTIAGVEGEDTYGQHAEGFETRALGEASHTEGYGTEARGKYSHAEGIHSYAEDYASHAEGGYTSAIGAGSHAEGNETVALGRCQHTQGEYNILDPEYDDNDPFARGKYAHIVGNGTDNEDRSNAHTLDWNGVAWFAGDVKVGGTG